MALLIVVTSLLGACSSNEKTVTEILSPEQRNAAIVAIAEQFAATQDAEAAQVALDALNLPDTDQAVLALAESFIAQGNDQPTTLALVGLAKAIGPVSRMASDYLAAQGQAPAAEAVAAAAASPTPAPTNTPVPPTDTPEPTATATPLPQPTATTTPTVEVAPQVVAKSEANVRRGPGTAYPVAGSMAAGEQAEVLGRNADSTWWQIALADGTQGWVNAGLVTANDAVEGVAIAQTIPTLAPTNTPAPAQPTAPAAPAATATPKPAAPAGVGFRIAKQRMLTIDENGGCAGNHNGFIRVIDANGNPLNGVSILAIWQSEALRQDGKPDLVVTSGSKGSDFMGNPAEGWTQVDMYKHGEQVKVIRDVDGREVSSEVTRSLDVEDEKIGPELLMANGYCPTLEECQRRINENTLCRFHYSWEVVFQRTY
jgi:uncharacterized protein YraI